MSAFVGALSHVVWDTFTHDDRWGPQRLRLLRAQAFAALGHDETWAKVLQYGSHVGGSIVALVLLGRHLRGLEAGLPPRRPPARFVVVTALGVGVGAAWALAGTGVPALRM